MPLSSGASDKYGNRYEGKWTARCLAMLLNEAFDCIQLEPPGPEGEGLVFSRISTFRLKQFKLLRYLIKLTLQLFTIISYLPQFAELTVDSDTTFKIQYVCDIPLCQSCNLAKHLRCNRSNLASSLSDIYDLFIYSKHLTYNPYNRFNR